MFFRTGAREELGAGIRAELPVAVGVLPFGLIYGVIAIAAGIPPVWAVAMSSIVFAGSAQFIGAQLIGGGVPGILIVMTTFIVNLRHALYSLSLQVYLRHLSARWRWLLAYLLTDEAYAVTIRHYRDSGVPLVQKHWYFLGSGLTLWLAWQMSTIAGVLLGAQIPESWGLDFTLALTFIGIIVPMLRDRPHVAAALVAGTVALVTHSLPYQLGLMVAALCSIAVGTWVESRS